MVSSYSGNSDAIHDISVQVLDFVSTFFETIGFEMQSEIPELSGPRDEDIEIVSGFIAKMRDITTRHLGKGQYDVYKHLFMEKFKVSSTYEFSQGDLDKIQELLNQLRDLFSKSEEIGEEHKSRLLRRLEKLQAELHKKVSDLDRFWGFFIDASIVVGMMGENAKPMVDVIHKIVSIIWPVQTRAYELPSDLPFKLLGQAEEDKSE